MKYKILIIGANGMLGSAILKFFCSQKNISIFATIRSSRLLFTLSNLEKCKLYTNIDVERKNILLKIFNEVDPDLVINCVGIVKQSKKISDILKVISLNSLFPHYLAKLTAKYSARLVHISTDCVFSGSTGNYIEDDFPDAKDLYGRSKLLGEVSYSHTITLRTSIIGHELNSSKSLLNWFLSQSGSVEGYTKAIFSGLTTYEVARVIYQHVIGNENLSGLYHLSASPISKHDLLLLIKDIYGKNINVIPENKKVVVNRSLDSSRFRKAADFLPKSWPLMIKEMKQFK